MSACLACLFLKKLSTCFNTWHNLKNSDILVFDEKRFVSSLTGLAARSSVLGGWISIGGCYCLEMSRLMVSDLGEELID